MATLLLHISDIHAVAEDQLAAVGQAIGETCCQSFEPIARVVVCLSGDLTYSGQATETAQLLDLCEALETALRARFGVTPTFVAVPGNHDCDHTDGDTNRQHLVLAARRPETELNNSLGWSCTKVQRNVLEFLDCVGAPRPSASPFVWSLQVPGTPKLRFVLVNSAWMSVIKEPHGVVRLPVQQIEDALCVDEDEIVVFVAHHPPQWLAPEDGRKLSELLSAYADVALFGHEHLPATHAFADLVSRTEAEVHHGAVLLHGHKIEEQGFRALLLSDDGTTVRVARHVQAGASYRLSSEDSDKDWRPLRSKNKPKSKLPQFEEEHARWLEETGLNLTHPQRPGGPTLADLFVWPSLQQLTEGGAEPENVSVLSASNLLNASDELTLVLGDEWSGKTTLAKMLVKNLRSFKKYALYIDAKSITNFHDKYFTAFFDKAANAQYGEAGSALYHQLALDDRLVIVDDLHRLQGNATAFKRLREFLAGTFGRVVLFANSDIEARAVDDAEMWNDIAVNAQHFQLLPFGHQLRYQLIEKWLSLGRESRLADAELERLVNATKRHVDQLVDKRTLPALPAYILIILQQMEVMAEAPSAIKDGSQGRMYEALITRDLDRRLSQLDLDGAFFYLARLAGHLSDKGAGISLEGFRSFHQAHCEEYCLPADAERLLAELTISRIVERRQGRVHFRHPYLFYFFLGKSLALSLDLPETKAKLRELVDSLHAEESYNALLFACYHDRTGRVLALVEERATELYTDRAESTFADFSDVMKKVQPGEARAILLDGERKTVRSVVNCAKDNEHRSAAAGKQIAVEIEVSDAQFQRGLELNGAVKCLQLLGQMLRNQSGTIDAARKAELLETSRALGGRIKTVLVASMRGSTPMMLALLGRAAETQLGADASEAAEIATKSLRGLIQRVGTTFALRTSGAIASRHLEPLLRKVLWGSENVDSQMLYLGAVLEMADEFPQEETERLWRLVEEHDVARKSTIRDYAVRRFYLHPDREDIKASVCKLLGIERRKLILRSTLEATAKRIPASVTE